MRDGIISLAQVSGAPIVPVSAIIRGKISLRSWDKFQIPLPFARCSLTFGKMIFVQRDIPEEARAALRAELRAEMMSITGD